MTATTSPPTEQSKARNRSILHFFATSLASRGLGIGCQLLQIPLALHYLGQEAFGVWVTLVSIAYLLTFSDLGVGVGAQNGIAEALGTGDRVRARRTFTTASAFLVAAGLLVLAVLAPVCWFVPWHNAFKLTNPAVIAQAPAALLAFAAISCVNIPLGMAQRLAYALQRGWLINAAQALGSALTLGAVALGAHLGLGFRDFIILTALPNMAVNLALLVSLLARLGLPGRYERWFDREILHGLVGLGAMFAVQQITNVLLFAAPPIIISAMAGAAAVAPFHLTQRIFNIFQMVQNAFILPLWPAYTDAKARRDWPWMERTLRRSLWATLWVAVVPPLLVAPFITGIIQWWVGKALPGAGLVAALLVWNIAVSLQQPLGFFLAGVSEVSRYTFQTVLTGVIVAVLMPLLGHLYGAAGVVTGEIIGFVPFALLGAAVEIRRWFRRIQAAPVETDTLAAPAIAL